MPQQKRMPLRIYQTRFDRKGYEKPDTIYLRAYSREEAERWLFTANYGITHIYPQRKRKTSP